MDLFSKQKYTAWAIILLVVLNTVTIFMLWKGNPSSNNQPVNNRMGGNGPDPLVNELIRSELGLSDEQFEKVLKIREEHHREAKLISRTTYELKKELMEQLFENSDPIAIELLTNEIGENQADFELEVFNHFKRIESLCNDEQKEKLKELLLKAESPPRHPHPGKPPHPPGIRRK